MWEQILALVGKVLAPREAAYHSGGTGGNVTLSVTSTSDRVEIPSWMRGKYVKLGSIGCNTFVQFGDSAVDVDATKANTLSTETITLADDVGYPVLSGAYLDCIIPLTATHMAWEGDGTGTLHMLPASSGKILRSGNP